MSRTLIALVLVVVLLVACGETSINPTRKKAWKKTVLLSSGEVTLDLSGEWDRHSKLYGKLWGIPPVENIAKIKQENATFIGTNQIANLWLAECEKNLKCELGKDGFKAVYE